MLPSAESLAARLRTAGCVFAEEEARLLLGSGLSVGGLDGLVRRRIAGEPLEHLLGWVEFCGLRLAVAPGVFVPRGRTALLAELALAALPGTDRPPVVVDLCCGCGAVAAVVAAARPDAELHAVDLDPVAVRCAVGNLPHAAVHRGDLYAALPMGLRGRVDVLVANAPYVPTAAIAGMPSEAREHEPLDALDGGPDGLEVLRRIGWEASTWLAPGGTLLVEAARTQVEELTGYLARNGLRPAVVTDDDRGATVVTGTAD